MKIEIYFLNSKLTTEINKKILVKELLYDIKQYLNTNDSNFILFDSNYNQLKETESISPRKDQNLLSYYLVKSSSIKNNLMNSDKKDNLTQNLKINQLIMKCTGAKKPLEIKNIPNQRPGLLELLENRNNPNGQGGDNAFDRLLNILQILEENNLNQIEFRGGQMANNAPVEADEQALRELQEMGFPEDRARQALINSRNDINRATELLLGEGGE